jgi:hypothetical protein
VLPALIAMDVSDAEEVEPDDPQPNANESTAAAAENEIRRELRQRKLLLQAMTYYLYLAY